MLELEHQAWWPEAGMRRPELALLPRERWAPVLVPGCEVAVSAAVAAEDGPPAQATEKALLGVELSGLHVSGHARFLRGVVCGCHPAEFGAARDAR